MSETALIIEVPESELLLGELRSQYDQNVSVGVPAHITILYPFIPESKLTEPIVAKLRKLASGNDKYSFQLAEWGRFDTALWLRPVPEQPFRELTLAVWRLFPSYPPYGGEYENVQPHLTTAEFDARDRLDSRWDKIEESTMSSLPINCVASGLSIYVSNDSGNWKRRLFLPFTNAGDSQEND